jgi:hypothetical protein
LGLENGHFWAKLHLFSTERQETAGSSVYLQDLQVETKKKQLFDE